MMLDDDLYSAVAGIPPSPLAPTPSQSGIDSDGYRITWGPSTCSILADFRARHPSSALATSSSSLASGLTSHAALNCVKRSSLNAGLGSPTRPGGASTPTGFEPTHHNRSVSSAAGASSSTISQGSRFSKRRRRIPTSVSWHGASSSSSHNISGWQDKSASTANASEDTMSMLDELAKRLEARQAQPGSPLAPRRTSAAAPQANKENRHLRADLKGKGKMCSPIVELEEQPTNGSIKTMSAKPIASNAVPEPRTPARPALAPKEDNIVKQSSQSRVYVKGSLPAEIVTIEQRVMTSNLARAPHEEASSNASAAGDEAAVHALDDDFWEVEGDVSLEHALSQMTIPPPSQPGSSQAALPHKAAPTAPAQKTTEREKMWTGYVPRDRRKKQDQAAENPVDAVAVERGSMGEQQQQQRGLSNRPLSGRPLARSVTSESLHQTRQGVSAVPFKPQMAPVKSSQTPPDAVQVIPAQNTSTGRLATSTSASNVKSLSSSNGASHRPFTKANSENTLRKPFKLPTVQNQQKNLAAREKQKSAKGVVSQPAPYQGDDLDDIDWGDDSFS